MASIMAMAKCQWRNHHEKWVNNNNGININNVSANIVMANQCQ
jgi:hypothetical protein